MTIERILNYKKYRSLFDILSDEFDSSTIEDKLVTLASLNHFNLFDQILKNYQEKYKESKDKYILDQLKPTLQYFISHLRHGANLTLQDFENQTLKKTIADLKIELAEKIETQFSLENLIKSYLNDNDKEFKRENGFFKIDFHEDLTEKLMERDLKENKSFEESYLHLYNFLKYNLIPDFKNQNFQGYSIDMGMSYQTEYLVRYYLQNPSSEDYLKAIQYAVSIIYLHEEPYHRFFIFRMYFSDNDVVKEFYDKDNVGVHFDTDTDMEDWIKLRSGQQPKQQYVQRWKKLTQSVEANDVIIIASYKNLGYKVGVIPKGTNFQKIGEKNKFYTIFPLERTEKIDIDKHSFIKKLIPANVTISPIYGENYRLRAEVFPKVIVNVEKNEIQA